MRLLNAHDRFSRMYWRRKWRILRDYGVGLWGHPFRNLAFLLWDPEFDNFTYDLGNVEELIDFLSDCLGADRSEVEGYVREPLRDRELRSWLRRRTRWRFSSKRLPGFGRRLGWYTIARLRRPSLIVETGIHDGLGSALLLRALELNSEDGVEGELVSFDPIPDSGWLVPERLRDRWDPRYVTSQEGFEPALRGRQVDFFIHDSDHSYEVEHFEFEAILGYAAPKCLLLSDNSHTTSALRDVAADIGRPYAFCVERPKRHWYPGAGIGLVVLEPQAAPGS